MAQILDCKLVAQTIKDECKKESDLLKAQGISPKLAVMRVGEKGPDLAYERGINATAEATGIEVEVHALPADVSQDDYITEFKKINADPSVHGILAFRPLDNIDETAAISDNLSAIKDCDASTSDNMGKVVINDPTALPPCTAAAVMEIIDFYSDEIKAEVSKKYKTPELANEAQANDVCCGLDVCIINNSNVIGKPLSMMLTNRFATVSIVHHLTHSEIKNDYIKRADVIVCATPFKDSITADMIPEGAIVIDAAIVREKAFDENGEPIINEKTGKQKINTFGCCSADVEEKASWKTPVPGVGGITSALLAKNLIKACKVQNNID